MEILDPGHDYLLDSLDGGAPLRLTFVKRDDPPEMYPGNKGHYPGTQFQEVLRAMIHRALYVNGQSRCAETTAFLEHLRQSMLLLESRVRRTRGQPGLDIEYTRIESYEPCQSCGHIECLTHNE